MGQHIVAIGGGGLAAVGERRPMVEFLLGLARRPHPRICVVSTATGDNPAGPLSFYDAMRGLDCVPSHLDLFPMPNVPDVHAHLLAQDVVYVGGGSVANLLAVWRTHGLDEILRAAWEAGIVLSGTSAGSLCWFEGGTTDSFGPDLQPVTNGLAFIPASNTPHYDSEAQRRPLYQGLVGNGTLSPGWAADDTVGLHFTGIEFAEAVSYDPKARAWRVDVVDGAAVEHPIVPRLLPGARTAAVP